MKIEHLTQFLEIVKAGSISKASQNLFVSHQHLSRIIVALEDEFQCQLLRRTSTGIALTSHGESFVRYAKDILAKYQEMQRFFHYESLPAVQDETHLQGHCHIFIPYFFSIFLTDFFQAFKNTYPDIDLQCSENPTKLPSDEFYGTIYAILGDTSKLQNIYDGKYVKHYIGTSETKICINRAMPLANESIITKEALLAQTSTLFPQNSDFQKNLGSKNILFSSSNIYQHLDSVKKNQSICILPSYTEEKLAELYPDITLRPFEQKMIVPIYMIYDSSTELSDVEKAVMRFWVQYMLKINPPEKLL